jgi:site-specific recombinase XerD
VTCCLIAWKEVTPNGAANGALGTLAWRQLGTSTWRETATLTWRLTHREVVAPFLAWAGERGVQDVDGLKTEHLRMYVLRQYGHLSPQTSRPRVAAIKTLGKWLEAEKWLPLDPFRWTSRWRTFPCSA